MATGSLALHVARDIVEFGRDEMAEAHRRVEAGWRHLPDDCAWVEFRGGVFAVSSMAGFWNEEDDTFTPEGTSARLPVWWKASGSSTVYGRAPGPGHCGE